MIDKRRAVKFVFKILLFQAILAQYNKKHKGKNTRINAAYSRIISRFIGLNKRN